MSRLRPVPAADPVPFATSGVDDAAWPVQTTHLNRFEINYVADDGTNVGLRRARQFHADRDGGARHHVGIDLYARHRDKVVACEDGRVVSFYGFYKTSTGEEAYALFVEHEDFVANYGEVKGDAQQEFGWRIGDRVAKGQEIARISSTGMLHFETYVRGTSQNERWSKGEQRPPHLRESSGHYCEGRDSTATNTSAETAEAGLFQTSYNARHGSPLMSQLFDEYRANPSGFVDVFREGAQCGAADFVDFGSGAGRDFQRLSKEYPAFAAEFAAVVFRNVRRHWGPINNKHAELLPACDDMFQRLQDVVDELDACPSLL